MRIVEPLYDTTARKRPVNLTLNEDLVERARSIAGNLSAVVESLLADYLTQERQRRAERVRECAAAAAAWNEFGERNGWFADEYSSL